MALKTDWAYDFACDRSMERMLALFNGAGPWKWEQRQSAWYGDYLNACPSAGVRVRVHEYPKSGESGVFMGLRDRGFCALLQIEVESPATQAKIDEAFRGLLDSVKATEITEIEPYD
jgi:hypothetical protein